MHVAHVRYASVEDGAETAGMGRKPDDWRVVPLCPRHHQFGGASQHSMGEKQFWAGHQINPYALAQALYASQDVTEMDNLVMNAKWLFPSRQ